MKLKAGGVAALLGWTLVGCAPEAGEVPSAGGEALASGRSALASTPTGSLYGARGGFELLALGNNQAMALGGNGVIDSGYPQAVELYDASTGSWSQTSPLQIGRREPAAVVLKDGRILITGGDRGYRIWQSEIFDPVSRTWSLHAYLAEARYSHTATVLNDGRVLLVGGLASSSTAASAELYNPVTGAFSFTGRMRDARYAHTATLLKDGRVLVVGGGNDASWSLDRAELYNPATGTWTSTPPLLSRHKHHSAVLLPDGKVMVVGGHYGEQVAEIYDPMANTWSYAGRPGQPRMSGFGLVLCGDSKVLLLGGLESPGVHLTSVERYDLATRLWVQEAPLLTPRSDFRAVHLGDKLLVASGYNATDGYLTSAELYEGCPALAPQSTLTAVYDPALKVPRCSGVGSSCDSGTLLVGRAQVGPETHAPNTLYGSCADGTAGSFHSDESLDRLKVSTVDGSALAAGKQVRIDASVWAWSGGGSDVLDLFVATNINSLNWTHVTSLPAMVSGAQTLSATFTLPVQGRLAIRGQFRYGGSVSPCTSGGLDDRDDLVFDVQ